MRGFRHGYYGTRLYRIYYNMKSRCYNESVPCYQYYGGKGVSVCKEWLDSFDSFRTWALSNGYSEQLTLDRIDVHGDYSPSNCRWIPMEAQAKNKSRTISVVIDGREIQLHQLSDETGISYSTLYWRYKNKKDLLGGN